MSFLNCLKSMCGAPRKISRSSSFGTNTRRRIAFSSATGTPLRVTMKRSPRSMARMILPLSLRSSRCVMFRVTTCSVAPVLRIVGKALAFLPISFACLSRSRLDAGRTASVRDVDLDPLLMSIWTRAPGIWTKARRDRQLLLEGREFEHRGAKPEARLDRLRAHVGIRRGSVEADRHGVTDIHGELVCHVDVLEHADVRTAGADHRVRDLRAVEGHAPRGAR